VLKQKGKMMSQNPVAVLGGGNGGHMMAVDLTVRGYPVHFYDHPQFEKSFKPTLTKGAVEAVGIGPRGNFPIHQLSMDMGETLSGVNWIHVVIPSNGHDLFFQEMLPHLRDGQKVVIWAGDFGALRLKKMLAQRGKDKGVTIIETNTLPYGTRLEGPAKINLLLTAPKVMAATLPASTMNEVIDEFRAMFPCIVEAKHVIAAAFNNPNPIVHPPGSLLNTGRIQYSHGDFYMYREGITEAVAFVIREIYEESRRVAEAFDFEMIQYRDTDFRTTASIMGVEFVAPFDTLGVIASIIGPSSLKDRYITEDLPFGLVPRSELGRLVNVPTPIIDGIVSIGCVVCQEDYWKRGRTLETLGLEGLTNDQILKLVEG
jgi:opine dehydrogenase